MAIFRNFYGINVDPDDLNAHFFPKTLFMEVVRQVESGLTTHGGENSIGPFTLDNFFDRVRSERAQKDLVRGDRIGHNGRRIRVDKNNLIALLAERARRLTTRVIELARLSNDDGPAPYKKNLFDVRSLGHSIRSLV